MIPNLLHSLSTLMEHRNFQNNLYAFGLQSTSCWLLNKKLNSQAQTSKRASRKMLAQNNLRYLPQVGFKLTVFVFCFGSVASACCRELASDSVSTNLHTTEQQSHSMCASHCSLHPGSSQFVELTLTPNNFLNISSQIGQRVLDQIQLGNVILGLISAIV